jgi:hypothetical protein
MGYGLSVFLVPQEDLARACGRNDEVLLEEALEALEDVLADYDEQSGAPSDDYDVDIDHEEALREIFAGRYTEGVSGSRYGWALECLCRFLGERLDNTGFCPCPTQWYFTLDEAMAEHGIPLRFTDLIFRSPVAIPEADDWPCVGHWTARDAASADRLEAALPRIGDAGIRHALETALGWLRGVADHPDCLIVGFQG